jgi:pimeloyl-ACP methyl ester carboxylesterase
MRISWLVLGTLVTLLQCSTVEPPELKEKKAGKAGANNKATWLDMKTKLVLPHPAGKYSVNRQWTSVVDGERHNREIPLFIYYPVLVKGRETGVIPTNEWRAEYLPVLKRRLGDSAAIAVINATATFSVDVPFQGKEKLPLILFSPGMNWSTLEYSYIMQELASAGYIIVAVNSVPASPVLQSPAGGFLKADRPSDIYKLVADDLGFVLSVLQRQESKLDKVFDNADFSRIAIAGHSLGGTTTLPTATNNPSVKAAVNMDGDLLDASKNAAPQGSVLFLNQVPNGFEKTGFVQLKANGDFGWRYQQMSKSALSSASAKYISIAGMYHSNFQDYALLPVEAIPGNLRKSRLGPIDGKACLQLINKILVMYFDETLKKQRVSWEALINAHPEVSSINIKE